jgi:hypothetical protein
MDFEDMRDKMIEITIGDKQYALLPLCTFHDIPNELYNFCYTVVEKQFGLKDTFGTFNLFEVVDPKKLLLAKIKYGI